MDQLKNEIHENWYSTNIDETTVSAILILKLFQKHFWVEKCIMPHIVVLLTDKSWP